MLRRRNAFKIGTILRRARRLVPILSVVCIAGCATPLPEPAQLSCARLDKELVATEQARRLAVEKREEPFEFVLPFAVGGVHVASDTAVVAADRWLARLRAERQVKGCAPQA